MFATALEASDRRVAGCWSRGYLARRSVVILLRRQPAWAPRSFRWSTPANSACGCARPTARTSNGPSRSPLEVLKAIEEQVGPRQDRDHAGLRRHDSLDLSDQRRLPVVARAGRGDAASRAQARQRRADRSAEGATARELGRSGCPSVRFSFEPADIVSEVMSFGSPTPIDVAVSGPNLAENRALCRKDSPESGRDRQRCAICRSPSRSTIRRSTSKSIARRRASAAWRRPRSRARWSPPRPRRGSSFPTTGPTPRPASATRCRSRFRKPAPRASQDLETAADQATGQRQEPVAARTWPTSSRHHARPVRSLQHAAADQPDGQHSRRGLGTRRAAQFARAIAAAGEPPKGVNVDVRGQIPPMQQMLSGLGVGLALAVVVIFLLLAANFQSLRLALVTVSTVPAVIVGVCLALCGHRAPRSTSNRSSARSWPSAWRWPTPFCW